MLFAVAASVSASESVAEDACRVECAGVIDGGIVTTDGTGPACGTGEFIRFENVHYPNMFGGCGRIDQYAVYRCTFTLHAFDPVYFFIQSIGGCGFAGPGCPLW
jgi:hypothetical protein